MAVSISLQIEDKDLPFFLDALTRAEQRAAGKTADEILDAASKLFSESQQSVLPDFIRSRLAKLDTMISMVRDQGWGLSEEDRNRIVAALTYFADPEDLIPDNIPVLGFLDDAIMLELAQELLQHEIDAYEDFRHFRNEEATRRGVDAGELTLHRVDWLDGRREELQERMRRRRRDSYSGASSSHWKPSLFKFS